jgi:hypothetical protein
MSVCCECCVSSGRGLCDELVTRSEESYRVCVCDRDASIMRRSWPTGGCCAMGEKKRINCLQLSRYLCGVPLSSHHTLHSLYLVCDEINHGNVACHILISELFVKLYVNLHSTLAFTVDNPLWKLLN